MFTHLYRTDVHSEWCTSVREFRLASDWGHCPCWGIVVRGWPQQWASSMQWPWPLPYSAWNLRLFCRHPGSCEHLSPVSQAPGLPREVNKDSTQDLRKNPLYRFLSPFIRSLLLQYLYCAKLVLKQEHPGFFVHGESKIPEWFRQRIFPYLHFKAVLFKHHVEKKFKQANRIVENFLGCRKACLCNLD